MSTHQDHRAYSWEAWSSKAGLDGNILQTSEQKVVQAMWKLLESEDGTWKWECQVLPPIFNLGQFWVVVGPEKLVLVGGEFCPEWLWAVSNIWNTNSLFLFPFLNWLGGTMSTFLLLCRKKLLSQVLSGDERRTPVRPRDPVPTLYIPLHAQLVPRYSFSFLSKKKKCRFCLLIS